MLRLRPFVLQDGDHVASWLADEMTFYKCTGGGLGDYPLAKDRLADMPEHMAFMALDEDVPVGFFTLRRQQGGFDHLRFCFVVVDDQKRGKGYGRRMLKLGLTYAKEICGAKKVSLCVFENNKPAHRCYEAIGFRDVVLDVPKSLRIKEEDWPSIEMEIQL